MEIVDEISVVLFAVVIAFYTYRCRQEGLRKGSQALPRCLWGQRRNDNVIVVSVLDDTTATLVWLR